MRYGTLRIRFLDGTDKDYPLDLPAAVVGRGEGASIGVDDFSISRRHASLAIDTGNLVIEDLGSATGTFLNGERLTPHVRYVVDPGDELRIGDLEAVYYPPPPAEATTSEGEAQGLPGGLHVVLISPSVPIDPGRPTTATLAVVNRARIVDEIELTIPALPATWYTITNPRFSLVPNAREEVQIVLHPPREHGSLAGEYDFAVHVRAREQDQEFITSGSFTVLPFESASVSLATVRTKRNFKVVAENTSNRGIRLELAGRDDEQAFQYEFAQPAVELQPGEKAVVPLRVKRKRQWLGTPSQPFFEVLGKVSDSGSEVTTRGQLIVNPPLEKFRMPVLFLLGAIILAFTALAVLILAGGDGVQTAGAESEYAGVHLCDDPAPDNNSGGGTASDGPVRPDATIAGAGNNSGGTPVFGNADSQGGPFFAQNDPRWANVEYARSTELPGGKDWCGTTIAQCGCAMTSVGVMLALYQITELPDGSQLNPEALNAWFNGEARRTERGWVSRGYIYGDVIWAAANAISGEMAKRKPGTPTVRFVRKGSGAEDEIRAELNSGRPVILEVPGHWIAAVGIDQATGDILINDPFYRDRTTLKVYAGKVRSSVIFEPSNDLSAVVLTAPADVKFRVIDKQGRVVGAGDVPDADAVVQIPGASFESRRAWRDPTCIEKAPPPGAGTNQIVLPGNAEDYTIEILDTGGQPGSVAVHTYGRDGTASISTIDTAGAAVAELSVDPESGTTDIQVTTGGTPTPAASTPTPGGDGGGLDTTPTPTTEPTQGPPPTPTPTPFEEATTNITLGAEPGQTRVETASNAGFELGDPIRFAPGQPNEEDNIIVGFGSMLLATPLKFAHGPGEVIERLPRPPGQGPGLPPGITPPPSTGPLEPPSTVGLACSTIYQPSPKLATFICDLQVTGEYTVTRWTLNGQIVPEFTGADSFVMTFPDDTPASIAASVCNVTICRSVSRQETIDFGTGLGSQGNGTGGTGTGGTGGTGPTPVPTPVPQGQVVVVCQTAFPISEDGQSAQFTCEANFSGEFTSIAWSAPGGTPANKSGQEKTFQTFIKNERGAPVSLRVTATVCNFGTCITSQPRVVGIGRTAVIMDSLPISQVHSGHRLTLMARVQGIGGITPQGGTVQFYVDPPFDTETQTYRLEASAAFGPSAPLFTTGDVAVAQVSVDTSNLNFGTTDAGVKHTFIGAYSGGTNAFGSSSAERDIIVLPPIPDGCDSVDEDDPPDGIVDNTCRNALDPATGFSVAGGYGVPKNLGGGTVITSVGLSSANALPGSTANTIVLRPNEPFTVTGHAGRTDYCPGCIRQVYIGIGSNATANVPAQGPVCVASGGMPLVMNASGMPNPGTGIAWSTGGLLRAPSKPGVYYVRATTTLDYFCVGPQVGPPETSIARVVVTDTVSTELDIRFGPSLSTTLPNLWAPWSDLTPATETTSTQVLILRARVDLEQTPSGRVSFTTPNSALFAPQTTNPNIAGDICPASGTLPGFPVGLTCVPGEARAFAVTAPAANGQNITVTARLQNQEIEVPHPVNATGTEDYLVRSAVTPVPANNTAALAVLMPSETTLTVSAGPVAICAQINSSGCQPITLTATVVTTPAGASAAGGSVEFYRRPNGGAADSWVLIKEEPVSNGQAMIEVHPGFGLDLVGQFQFQARFVRGTTNIEPSSSAASAALTLVRATPTVVVNSVLPQPVIIGGTISVTATVTGANGYLPSGTVQFRVRPAGGTASSEENLGTPVPLTEDAGVWTATLPATLTGEDNTVLENSGNFEVRAVFAETATLASVTSAAFPFSIGPEAPGITVTLPDTDPGTAGNQVQAGQAQNIQVQLSGSRTPRLNNSGNSSSGLSVTVLNNGLSIGTAAINEQGAATFSVAGLNAGTYNITVSYSGYPQNLYYSPVTSSPAQTLTVTPITPVVTVNAITADIGTNVSLTATVPAGSGVTSPAGGSISFYVGSVGAGNLLGTDTTLTSGGAVLTATLSVPTGDGQALSTADTAYTIIAQYNGNATNGNFAVSTSTANATNSKSVTLTKRSSSATVPAGSGQRSTQITLNATVAATGSPTTSIAPTCSNCLQFQVQVDATGGPSSNGQWTNIPGALVDVASNGAASATFLVPTPGPNALFTAAGAYNVRAVYNGNSNLNNVTSSAAVFTLTLAQPTVAVSAIPNVTIGNTFSITATVSGSGTTDPAGGTVTFRLGTTVLGTATVSSGAATLTGIPTGPGTNFQSPTGTGVSYDNITARFNGDAANGNVGAVTSPAASVVINKANVTLNVTYPAGNTVVVGTNAVITATLTGFHPGSLANNGARIFFENGGSGMLGGTVEVTQISAGVWGATFNVQNLNASTYGITARYEGNAIYNAATSPETAFVVTQFTPTVTITSPTSPHTVTSPTQVSITVSVPGTGMRSPVGGTVSLLIGDTVIATSAALTGTTATFNLTTTGGGTLPASGSPYTIVARFNGNTNLNQATSASITVNVNPAGP